MHEKGDIGYSYPTYPSPPPPPQKKRRRITPKLSENMVKCRVKIKK
jgi:hypothetical protein